MGLYLLRSRGCRRRRSLTASKLADLIGAPGRDSFSSAALRYGGREKKVQMCLCIERSIKIFRDKSLWPLFHRSLRQFGVAIATHGQLHFHIYLLPDSFCRCAETSYPLTTHGSVRVDIYTFLTVQCTDWWIFCARIQCVEMGSTFI